VFFDENKAGKVAVFDENLQLKKIALLLLRFFNNLRP